jgi:hypothetical protein
MSKNEMIKKIQISEAKAWGEFQSVSKLWGADDEIVSKRRAIWVAIDNLRESMGIERIKTMELIELGLF